MTIDDDDQDELSAGGGTFTERDENGVIRKAGLSSERAADLARRRWEKSSAEKKAEQEAEIAGVLADVGYDLATDAPTSHRALAREFVVEGNVAALKVLLSQTRRLARMADQRPGGGGLADTWDGKSACPTCGGERTVVNLTLDGIEPARRFFALIPPAAAAAWWRGVKALHPELEARARELLGIQSAD